MSGQELNGRNLLKIFALLGGLFILLIIFLFILAATSPDNHKIVKSAEFSNWPFKHSEHSLGCTEENGRPLVFIKYDDKYYAINGAARGLGRKLNPDWLDGSELQKEGTIPADTDEFIKIGVQICKDTH